MPERRLYKEPETRQFTSPREAPKFFSPAVSNKNTAIRPKAEAENFKQSDANKANYVCSRCSKPTVVSFVPDGIRPIFCKDCLSLAKKEKNQEIENRLEAKKRELAGINNFVKPESRANFSGNSHQSSVSLGQAIKSGPVNFQGKKIEPKRESPIRQADEKTTKSENLAKANQTGTIIKEDENIILRRG